MPDELSALALANDLVSQVAPKVGRYLIMGLEGADNTRIAYLADLRSTGIATQQLKHRWLCHAGGRVHEVAHLLQQDQQHRGE